MAQVYSVNIVGYVNLSIPVGFSMIANQLNNSPDNQLATLIPTPPDQTTFYKFVNASSSYLIDQFADGAWGGDTSGAMTLNPGEGVFVNSLAAFTATFVGEVQLSTPAGALPIATGFSIVSSPIPQQGFLDTDLNYGTPNDQETFYQFNNASTSYSINQWADAAWGGDAGGNAPTIHVGEAFFVSNPGAAHSWTRTFSVGP
jgi:hypothetical protein